MAITVPPSIEDWAIRGSNGPLLFLAAYTLVWTVFSVFSDPGGLHHDMTEAYAWGREFQLGYYKHPPFWAWLAGLWFEVFPRENWAFYLLATLCTGIGVLGVWALAGLFAREPFPAASALLILLIPFYSLQGHKFNANLILVPLWPWTVYFFVRSIEKLQLKDAILFGAFAAAGLLSKYYSALLLLSCVTASFLHPNYKAYYRNVSPYLAVGVCALLVAPHVWWLTQHDFQTLTYMETRTAFTAGTVHNKLLAFIFGCLGLCAGVIAVVLGVRLWGGRWRIGAAEEPLQPDRLRFVLMLALGPFILTVVSAIAGNVRLSTNFASPIFFLVPLVLLQVLKPRPSLAMRAALGMAVCLTVAALLVSPLVPSIASVSKQRAEELSMPEIARGAEAIWRAETGLPLRIIAGNEVNSVGVAFYSPDNTSAFIAFDKGHAPWINDAALRKSGFLGLCFENDTECASSAHVFAGSAARERTLTIARRDRSGSSSPLVFRLIIAAPGEAAQVPTAAIQ